MYETDLDLKDLANTFSEIRNEIGDIDYYDLTFEGTAPEVDRMDYTIARNIVAKSIKQIGFIEIDGVMHDSVDDCADILMDLSEIEELQRLKVPADYILWKYLFNYQLHFNDHMKNIEKQIHSTCPTRRCTGAGNASIRKIDQ